MSYTVLQCPVLTAKERPHPPLFKLFRRFDARRIFGFIRRLGGMSRPKVKCYDLRSTHALRVEGDADTTSGVSLPSVFLSMPSGWRAIPLFSVEDRLRMHFYPRPLGGGRRSIGWYTTPSAEFLSTPSGWRATAKTDKVFVCFCAKGRRICLFKTRKERICRWRFKKDKFWVLIWCEGSGKSVCALASHCG